MHVMLWSMNISVVEGYNLHMNPILRNHMMCRAICTKVGLFQNWGLHKIIDAIIKKILSFHEHTQTHTRTK